MKRPSGAGAAAGTPNPASEAESRQSQKMSRGETIARAASDTRLRPRRKEKLAARPQYRRYGLLGTPRGEASRRAASTAGRIGIASVSPSERLRSSSL